MPGNNLMATLRRKSASALLKTQGHLHSANTAGTINSNSSGAISRPPSTGAAMRPLSSAPVPLAQTTGTKPARITATVIA
jgi:hypothetical protein